MSSKSMALHPSAFSHEEETAHEEMVHVPSPATSPWLFLTGAASFVITVVISCWIALQSF
jgi:hypothetical protein